MDEDLVGFVATKVVIVHCLVEIVVDNVRHDSFIVVRDVVDKVVLKLLILGHVLVELLPLFLL